MVETTSGGGLPSKAVQDMIVMMMVHHDYDAGDDR